MENPYCKYNAKNWLDDNPMSEEQRKYMFPGISSEVCSNIQGGIAKSGNYDQITYDNQIQSYITENGLPCWYYPYLFQEEKMEELTGEHNSASYGRPFEILMVLKIQDAPSWVSGLGIENNEKVTAWIHIRTFKNKIKPILADLGDERNEEYNLIYNANAFDNKAYLKKIMPKPKDCFQVLTSACDREWDAGARIWEITNVEDEIFAEGFNMAQGHYVWKITAKRYRYSFEHGMSTHDEKSANNPMLGQMGEKGNHQVYENEVVKMYMRAVQLYKEQSWDKILTEQGEPIIDDGQEIKQVHFEKKYSQQQICQDAKKEVFDMNKNDTSFYNHLDSGGFF